MEIRMIVGCFVLGLVSLSGFLGFLFVSGLMDKLLNKIKNERKRTKIDNFINIFAYSWGIFTIICGFVFVAIFMSDA